MASSIEQLEYLRQSGLPGPQAEAVLRVIEQQAEASLLRNWMTETFATKLELAEMNGELIKWLVGVAVTATGIALAVVYFLLGHLNP